MTAEPEIKVRPFRPADAGQYVELRKQLWPSCSLDDHVRDIAGFLNRPGDELALVASDAKDNLYGFAEVRLRPYAEGCRTSPVAYMEGWFVAAPVRGRGLGRALFAAAESWALGKGLKEMASDTEVENGDGRKAHEALGYKLVSTNHCFMKAIKPPPASRP